MELRNADLSDMLESIDLPEFRVRDEREERSALSELTDGACRIMLWLEESKEPTEHILNEMMEQGGGVPVMDVADPVCSPFGRSAAGPDDPKGAAGVSGTSGIL